MTRPSRPSVVRRLDRLLDERGLVEDHGQLRAGGGLQVGQPVRMSCEIATALPSGAAVTAMPRLSLPLVRVIEVAGASCCSTVGHVAEPDRGGAGAGQVRCRAGRPGWRSACPTCTARSVSPSATAPAGTATPLVFSAVPIAVGGSFAAASFAGSGVITTSCVAGAGHLDRADPVDRLQLRHHGRRAACSASAGSSPPPVAASTTAGRSSVLPAMTCGSTPCGQLGVDPVERGLHLVDRVVDVGAELVTAPGRWPSPRGRSR